MVKRGRFTGMFRFLLMGLVIFSVFFQNTCFVSADSMKENYDADGNVVQRLYYRGDGSLEQAIKYDALGNKTEVAYYGSNGKLRENSDGWAAIKWKYEHGSITQETYYGADGRIKERKQYNELGDLVAKQYVGDGSIDPSEEYNPMPTLSGETNAYYDSYGRSEGETTIIRE